MSHLEIYSVIEQVIEGLQDQCGGASSAPSADRLQALALVSLVAATRVAAVAKSFFVLPCIGCFLSLQR